METTEMKQGVPAITLAMLIGDGACPEQRATFKREWPAGAELTLANVRRAQELGLDLEWGKRWMSAPAQLAFNEAIAPAWQAFNEAIAPARKAYNEAIAPAWQAYNEANARARTVYNEANARARTVYNEANARAWLSAMLDSLAVTP